MQTYNRRQALKYGAVGLGTLAIGACSGTSSTSTGTKTVQKGASESVGILYDWTYNGPPGQVEKYWKTIQSRLSTGDRGVQLASRTETTFENLYAQEEAAATAKSGSDLTAWFADYHTFREAYRSNIVAIDKLVAPGAQSHWLLNSSKFNGSYWGSPLVMEIAVMAVNRKLLRTAKVDVGDRWESWDAFLAACDKLKSAGIRPIQAGTSDGFNAEKWLYLLEFQVCDDITSLLGGITGDLSLDSPFFAFPREQLALLVSKYMNEGPQNDTETVANTKFLQGSAAMTLTYTSTIFDKSVSEDFDVVGFPASNAKYNRPAVGVADNIVVMNYSHNQEAAGKLLQFLSEPAQVQLWWELNGSLPANDQLDISNFTARENKVWQMVIPKKNDPYALWWPGNQPPDSLFTFQYGVTQSMFAGTSPSDAKNATDRIFSTWRDQNPAELAIVKAYKTALAQSTAQ